MAKVSSVIKDAAQKTIPSMSEILVEIVPTNVADAAAKGNMLQIVFFSTFFGIAAAMGAAGEPVVKLAQVLLK